MDLRDVEKVAVDTYRKMSIIEHNRACPVCKKDVTMIGVSMFDDSGEDELNRLGAKSFKRCLGCLTLFEERLVAVLKEMTKTVVVTVPSKQSKKTRSTSK